MPLTPNDLLKIPIRGQESQTRHQISHIKVQVPFTKIRLLVTGKAGTPLAVSPVFSLGLFSNTNGGPLDSKRELLKSSHIPL